MDPDSPNDPGKSQITVTFHPIYTQSDWSLVQIVPSIEKSSSENNYEYGVSLIANPFHQLTEPPKREGPLSDSTQRIDRRSQMLLRRNRGPATSVIRYRGRKDRKESVNAFS